MIEEYSLEAGVSSSTLTRIIRCESNFNPKAKNPNSSAKGLAQIIDGTWKHFKCEGEPLDARDNIRCATKILKDSVHHWDASVMCHANLAKHAL